MSQDQEVRIGTIFISPKCRELRGEAGAFSAACATLSQMYAGMLSRKREESTFGVSLSLYRPSTAGAAPADWRKRAEQALNLAYQFGGIDGEHHKDWLIDQMVRAITGSQYDEWVRSVRNGSDGPETYDWNVGVAP